MDDKKPGMLDKKARDALVMSIYYYCVQQAGRYSNYRYEHADALQDALQGAIEAAEKFEPERGVPFLGYAQAHVKRSIMIGIARQRTSLKIPSQGGSHKMYSAVKDIPERGIEGASALHNIPLEHLRAYMAACRCMPDITGLAETMRDNGPDTSRLAIDNDLKRALRAAMWVLDERSRLYIREYYYEGLNLREIAKKYGYSQERIRQILARAIETMRASAWHLRDFMEG